MSLIPQASSLKTHGGSRPVIASLEDALSSFAAALTDDERTRLQGITGKPNSSAALDFTARLDLSNSTRRGKSVGSRVYLLLLSVQKFSDIVDTFVSSNPAIAALVWGSIKLTLLIAVNITSYCESLAELFMSLSRLCPQFDDYQLLYPNSPELQRSICEFHASIVEFCKQSIQLTRQSWVKKVTISLRDKLQPCMDNIQRRSSNVKDSIALAKATYDRKSQQFQEDASRLLVKQSSWLSKLTSRNQQDLEAIREWQLQRVQEILREKRRRLLDCLSTYKYQLNFHQARKKRHVNTATWLLSTPEFVKWRDDSTSSVFILTGKLGSGKTVLTTGVIEHLCSQRKPGEHITFLFPRFDDSLSLSADTVLRSIVRQSLELDKRLTKKAESLLTELEMPLAGLDIIETLLNHCLDRLSTCYIIIDSLDEFEQSEFDVLSGLLSRTISKHSNVKIFLVGRDSILKNARQWFSRFHHISVKTANVQSDVELYTRETLVSKWGKERVQDSPALAKEIIEVLSNKANGMFLWVNYQIIEICKQACDAEIRLVLGDLPGDLGETFDRALKRILKYGSVKTATQIFRWTSATKEPLTVGELEDALSYEPGQPYTIPERRPRKLAESVTTWCENLVELDDELGVVQFPHRSILEHFLREPSDLSLEKFHINLDDADHFIGEICVTYLNLNDFKTTLARRPAALPIQLPNHIINEISEDHRASSRFISKVHKLKSKSIHAVTRTLEQNAIIISDDQESWNAKLHAKHAFLNYALNYWLVHTRNFDEHKSKTWGIWKHMLSSHHLAETPWAQERYDGQGLVAYHWVAEHDHFPAFQQIIQLFKLESKMKEKLVYYYTDLGLTRFITSEIMSGISDEGLSNGLINAARGGHLEVAHLLLNAKADVNAAAGAGDYGRTALQAAAEGGHLEVVQILLNAKADADVNAAAAAGDYGRTALQAAAKGGHLEVKELLTHYGARR
ncbi:hypothetical protein BP6252_07337 [Coleophoma cylindrospora]|uniref:Uncharacterized protein n=1 Tax=Coleophoma cylindrospora TaxID=1849047 RepID=A0A3D8RHH9_9HELO|nr:hypothetical protein BP6252_07337 [Coleophoma cylindrospora]